MLHKAGGGGRRLFDHVGDGAEGAEEARGPARGLGLLRLLGRLGRTALLGGGGAGRRLGWCRSFGWGLGRYGGCPLLRGRGRRGRWCSRRVRPLEVRHVAVGQVGHEAAVRKATAKEVHGCGWMAALSGIFLSAFCEWSSS